MRRFRLKRHKDISGVSGVGYVAEGIQFSNGKVAISWYSDHSSVNIYENIDDMILVHGHQGLTIVEFID